MPAIIYEGRYTDGSYVRDDDKVIGICKLKEAQKRVDTLNKHYFENDCPYIKELKNQISHIEIKIKEIQKTNYRLDRELMPKNELFFIQAVNLEKIANNINIEKVKDLQRKISELQDDIYRRKYFKPFHFVKVKILKDKIV